MALMTNVTQEGLQSPGITVMFGEQTVRGELAKRLQPAEEKLDMITGYKIKIMETRLGDYCQTQTHDCYSCSRGL